MDRRERTDPPALERIELLVLDVDGVLTDGRIVLDADGREGKQFSALDGAGLKYWQRAGRQAAILSGRSSRAVIARAAELGIAVVVQNAKRKLPAYEKLLSDMGRSDQQTAVMGDDLPDLPLMRRCGLAVAPANAVEEVRAAAAYVTTARAGAGAVREVVEYVLKGTGEWSRIMERYGGEAS